MTISPPTIERIVLEALSNANMARPADQQLRVAPDAPIFGRDSAMDSLGLVALLIDIEEALAAQGVEVTLSDERAMSQRNSPFRSVATLVEYIHSMVDAA